MGDTANHSTRWILDRYYEQTPYRHGIRVHSVHTRIVVGSRDFRVFFFNFGLYSQKRRAQHVSATDLKNSHASRLPDASDQTTRCLRVAFENGEGQEKETKEKKTFVETIVHATTLGGISTSKE